MTITCNISTIIVLSVILGVWAEVTKLMLRKHDLEHITKSFPIIMLILSFIIFRIKFGPTYRYIITYSVLSAALSCYLYDLYRSFRYIIHNINSKVRTSLH